MTRGDVGRGEAALMKNSYAERGPGSLLHMAAVLLAR